MPPKAGQAIPYLIQEVRHIHDEPERTFHIKVERNSRGINWEISIRAPSLEETLELVEQANARLQERYGVEAGG